MGCMELEERTLETMGDRCEICGARLTQEELEISRSTPGYQMPSE